MSKKFDSGVKNLKKLLFQAEDFSEVMSAFYDLAEHREFLGMGRPKQNVVVAKMIQVGINHLFPNSPIAVESRIFFIRRYNLYHGPLTFGKLGGSILYFSKNDKGMMAVTDQSGKTDFMRLTATMVPSNADRPLFAANPANPATD